MNLLLKVLEQEPDHIDALLLSAVADTRLKRYEQAIRALDRGLVLYNGDEPSTFLHLLQTTGEVEALPHDEKPLCLAALFHRYLRIFDSAHAGTSIRYAEQAVTANDHADVAYFTIGIVHFREREFDDALPMFQKAIEVNPKHGFAYRWASAIYSDRGELSNEYHMLQKAYEVNPEDQQWPFHVFLAEKIGDYEQALAISLKILDTHPDDWNALFFAARMYHRTGREETAHKYYKLALARAPRNAEFYDNYGADLSDMNLEKEAVTAFQTAISIEPNRGTSYYGLGVVLDHLGRYQEAAAQYEVALRFGSLDVEGQLNLCAVYHLRLLDFQRAVSCYQDLLRRDPHNGIAQTFLGRAQSNL